MAPQLADLQRVSERLRITIRRSRTDQDGVGAAIAIPEGRRLSPKALLGAWIERTGITDERLFRRLSAGG